MTRILSAVEPSPAPRPAGIIVRSERFVPAPRAQGGYSAARMALKVALGRIAAETRVSSGM